MESAHLIPIKNSVQSKALTPEILCVLEKTYGDNNLKVRVTRYDLPDRFFVFTLDHCVNFSLMRHESTSFNRIIADKTHGVRSSDNKLKKIDPSEKSFQNET